MSEKRTMKLAVMVTVLSLLACTAVACGKKDQAQSTDSVSVQPEAGDSQEETDDGGEQQQTSAGGEVQTMDCVVKDWVRYDNQEPYFYVLPDGETNRYNTVPVYEPDGGDELELLYGDHLNISYQDSEDGYAKQAIEIERLEPVYEIKTVEGIITGFYSDEVEITTDSGDKLELDSRYAKVIIRNSDCEGYDPDITLLNYGERVRVEYIEYSEEELKEEFYHPVRVIEELADYSQISEATATVIGVDPENDINLMLEMEDGSVLVIIDILSHYFNYDLEMVGVEGAIEREGLKLKLEYRGAFQESDGKFYLQNDQLTRITYIEG